MGDQLGQHRVVIEADLRAGLDATVEAHAMWRLTVRQFAGRRLEGELGALGRDARLDRVTAHADLRLRQRELFAGRRQQLPFDEIDAGDEFGDGMLDLQSRVHFQEIWSVAVPAP